MEIQKEQLEKVINEIKSNFHQGLNDENYFNTFIEPIKILNIKNNKIFLYGSSQYIIDSLNEK
jgi:predicted methyltransferase